MEFGTFSLPVDSHIPSCHVQDEREGSSQSFLSYAAMQGSCTGSKQMAVPLSHTTIATTHELTRVGRHHAANRRGPRPLPAAKEKGSPRTGRGGAQVHLAVRYSQAGVSQQLGSSWQSMRRVSLLQSMRSSTGRHSSSSVFHWHPCDSGGHWCFCSWL